MAIEPGALRIDHDAQLPIDRNFNLPGGAGAGARLLDGDSCSERNGVLRAVVVLDQAGEALERRGADFGRRQRQRRAAGQHDDVPVVVVESQRGRRCALRDRIAVAGDRQL